MAMGRARHTKFLLVAVLLLLTLAKGSNCNKTKTCTVADLEIRHIQVDSYKHGNRTQEQQHMNPTAAGGGRKLKQQMPMVMAVWVYNHCPCMVDNVVIYAPDGFNTIFPNGTDGRIFSKVREHLYLIHNAGPLQQSAGCPPFPPSPAEASVTSAAGPVAVDAPAVKDYRCPSTAFFYTWYEQIELKLAFLS